MRRASTRAPFQASSCRRDTGRISSRSTAGTRSLLVEGSGGPTWYTEYNVLTGLSARSYGRLSYYVTRIAAGRVNRGLPGALHPVATRPSRSIRPMARFSARRNFRRPPASGGSSIPLDMKAGDVEPDRFYFDQALQAIQREQGDQPLFIMVYTVFNHFPWWNSPRPELTPDWRSPGNDPEVDEYLRRQSLSARDYADFKHRLAADFAGKPFLVLRFGDHQPGMARMIDPSATDDEIAQRIMGYDLRYFTTYYASTPSISSPWIRPRRASGWRRRYLPLVVQEMAGIPLDPSFAEQKENSRALPRAVLSMRRRRRGPPLQPAADRCRPDQGHGIPLSGWRADPTDLSRHVVARASVWEMAVHTLLPNVPTKGTFTPTPLLILILSRKECLWGQHDLCKLGP